MLHSLGGAQGRLRPSITLHETDINELRATASPIKLGSTHLVDERLWDVGIAGVTDGVLG
ncbi:hypothetical protein CWI37_2344p0010 [Hamiltosporidium tvaerminnensis]|uniref:Uncharacterized protein n=1 Tax=Hamiltosporidium tvaerminnensis TaxID=1176355 RepID=A0A4Q9KS81_9MICR|nr:hypothetical protein CWI37_2344p0010 [Hamiltosporidium tvaerminnensis]